MSQNISLNDQTNGSPGIGRFWPLLRFMLTLAITSIIVWWLLSQVSIQTVKHQFVNASINWLLVGVVFYGATIILRSARFGLLLEKRRPKQWRRLIPEVLALSVINNLLPVRVGELSFPILLSKKHRIPVAQGVSALLVARYFDLLSVFILFSLVRSVDIDVGQLQPNLWVLYFTVIGLGLGGFLGARMGPTLFEQLQQSYTIRNFRRSKRSIRIIYFVQKMVDAFQIVAKPTNYLVVLGLSLAGWLTTYAWFWAFLQAISIILSYPKVIFGASFGVIAKAIPFTSIGGIGAHEAGWAWGFQLVGLTKEMAISSGFTINLYTMLTSILITSVIFALRFLASDHADNDK